ncbi:glycosyltransferase family 2 protein [Ectopseudomonas oleovorans]|uniref:Glycosyltransferase family 2 protein n=2 Tax=Ectopseudomonas oleovorans TaxID=301 RepID=A0A061CM75_ECTOL|nr:glycosyltransferase family 2 protein [Pseudomonas oleovorans]RRW31371.1 glycosyltransferase family 2 protein [Pseudomonas oleovorans]CDM39090.1 glycosyl transferase, family 2 [Pseudomonas oleovorans CECT 5344]CDR89711.1 glycosyl transferase, family 2 [Pseudomonas oleovorans]
MTMLAKPLISVVIPAYNYAATLPRAVNSVLAQLDQSGAELLVINDGSTDDTQQVIERLQAENPGRFRAILKANGGLSSVRNRGIREAVGAYLIFLDADDELAPGALSALAAHIAEQPQTRMVIGGHCSIGADGKRREHLPAALPESRIERLRGYLLDKRVALSNGACAMHRDIFARADYPEAFRSAEDIPVFAQALANYECTVLAKPLALIYKHDDSLRHQFSHAKAGGLALVEEVFAPQRLDARFQSLKAEFYVQRCLSLFRSAYLAGDKAAAKSYFAAAAKADWRVLLKGSYVRKALRLWLGVGR